MNCPYCVSNHIRKNGHRRGKQNYICVDCEHQFIESYSKRGYNDEIKQQCLTMYVNGIGFRAIERLTGVNHNTVINWVKEVAGKLPDAPEHSEIPEVAQVDELETFVSKKKQNLVMDSGK
jgi:transposase-like protein